MAEATGHTDSGEVALEIHRADPTERRRNLMLTALAAVVGVLLIAAMQLELADISERVRSGDAEIAAGRFILLARASFVLLALVGVITGAVIARSALAVIREQRYPHADAKLLRDRKVTRGARAVTLGRLGLVLAAAFAVVGCTGAIIGWQLLDYFK